MKDKNSIPEYQKNSCNSFELRLYSPLTANLLQDDYGGEIDEYFDEFEGWPLDGADLIGYEDVIREGIEQEQLPEEAERGLMQYYNCFGDELPSLEHKVLSAFPDVEVYKNRLWGVLKCTLKAPLTQAELAALKEMAVSRYADGWGEGYEQRPRQIDSGELYVHFWQSDKDFRVQTEQELKGLPEIHREPRKKHRNNQQER